jgi:hypothetical protein
LYAHGGLFPEEVIIPWFVFIKQETKPIVSIKLAGKGQARKKATAKIIIMNTSSAPINLEKIHIAYHGIHPIEKEFNLDIPPLTEMAFDLELASWPSQKIREMILNKLSKLKGNLFV